MKKTLPAIITAVLVLYPVSAWLMGYVIERRISDGIKEMDARNSYVRVVDNQFRRGWFVSEDDSTVEIFRNLALPGANIQPLGPAAAPAPAASSLEPMRISIHNIIRHGPVCGWTCLGLARFDSHIIFADRMQTLVASIFGSAEPLIIRSRLGFFGGGSATMSSPPVQDATLSDGAHVASDGFRLDIKYGSHYDSYEAHGSLPHLRYAGADGKQFEVTTVRVNIDSKRALRSLYTGDSSVTVGRVVFGGVGGIGAITANDIETASHTSVADDFMSMTTRFDTGAISGPLSLANAHFDFTFRHLDLNSLERLSAAMREADQSPTLPPVLRLSKMMSTVKLPAISLLSHEPEVSFDRVSLATDAGAATLTGLIKIHGVVAEDFADNPNQRTLIQKLDADMDLTADEALLTSLPRGANSAAQLQPLVSQGLVTHDGGKFHTIIGFHHGQATFNGKPFRPGGSTG